jgi:cytochrome b subunit of formate dehydrogenase
MHAFLAWCAMILIVLAAITGSIMILLAEPKG